MLAGVALIILLAADWRQEGFEPIGTCWKDMKGGFELKRILWAAQTLAWRVMGRLLSHHADSPYTKDLLRKSKLEFRLPTDPDADVAEFDAETGCVALNLDHPAMQRVPDALMKKAVRDMTPEDIARTLLYANSVTKAVVHALASVHGRVGTAAHDKAYDFYAYVIVNEMSGPKHVMTKLAR